VPYHCVGAVWGGKEEGGLVGWIFYMKEERQGAAQAIKHMSYVGADGKTMLYIFVRTTAWAVRAKISVPRSCTDLYGSEEHCDEDVFGFEGGTWSCRYAREAGPVKSGGHGMHVLPGGVKVTLRS